MYLKVHKMRAVLLFSVCAWVVVGAQDFQALENMPKYDSRYDYLDVDDILTSRRLVRNYVNCLLYSQRCPPEGKDLKKVLPDALRTKCIRCTEKQKRGAVKVIRRLKEEFPEEWAKLQSRWDPTGDLTRYFENHIAKEYFPQSGSSVPASQSTFVPPAQPAPTQPPPPPSPAVPLNIPQTMRAPPTTPPQPVIINRFGEDSEVMMGSPSGAAVTPRPMFVSTPRPVLAPTPRPAIAPTPRPAIATNPPARPTQGTVVRPTRVPTLQVTDMPIYTTAVSIIDLISDKIKQLVKVTVEVVAGNGS